MQKVAFIIPPTVELLDLAGPAQVFTEAKFYGFEIDIEFYQFQEAPVSTAGLGFEKKGILSSSRACTLNMSGASPLEQKERFSTG
jgi:hypothetical protein